MTSGFWWALSSTWRALTAGWLSIRKASTSAVQLISTSAPPTARTTIPTMTVCMISLAVNLQEMCPYKAASGQVKYWVYLKNTRVVNDLRLKKIIDCFCHYFVTFIMKLSAVIQLNTYKSKNDMCEWMWFVIDDILILLTFSTHVYIASPRHDTEILAVWTFFSQSTNDCLWCCWLGNYC